MRSWGFHEPAAFTQIDGEWDLYCTAATHYHPLEPGHYRFEKNFNGASYYIYYEITE